MVYFYILPTCVDEEVGPPAVVQNYWWGISQNNSLPVVVLRPRQAHLIPFALSLSSSTLPTGGQTPIALNSPG